MADAKKYLHDTMDEWDTIFDPPIKCEYDEQQLIRFAELWAELEIKEYKLKQQNYGKTKNKHL